MYIFGLSFIFYFLSIFYWLYSCPIFPPLPCFSPLSSCPWVIHLSSLASPFPILFLTSPYFVPTNYAYFLYLFLSYSPYPTDNPPCDLHFCDSVPVLVVCLVCFCFGFRCVVVNNCEFAVIFTVHIFCLLFLRWVPLTFHIIRAGWWWTSFTRPYLGSILSALPF